MNSIFGLGHETWELKKKNQKNFKRKLQVYLAKKTKMSNLKTELLLVQNVEIIHAVNLEREWFLYLSSVLRNLSYELEKSYRHFFLFFFVSKKPILKKIDVVFRLNSIQWNACTIYESMDPVFSLRSEIEGIEMKNCQKWRFFQELFSKKHKKTFFWNFNSTKM